MAVIKIDNDYMSLESIARTFNYVVVVQLPGQSAGVPGSPQMAPGMDIFESSELIKRIILVNYFLLSWVILRFL